MAISKRREPGVALPLSIILQGKPNPSSSNLIFLFPDGSGSGMAYASLPQIDPELCVVALNSPFLAHPEDYQCSIEECTSLWLNDIRRRQTDGPYRLGGWSAGGYYAFEAAKAFVEAGERVDSLILIDSPCRLLYGALPMRTVEQLAENSLMGNWNQSMAPAWMISHFRSTINAIERYRPTAMPAHAIARTYLIWAEKGVLEDAGSINLEVDHDNKINQLLLQPRKMLSTLGWDQLLPGSLVLASATAGNHFQLVHRPYCATLASLLLDCWRREKM